MAASTTSITSMFRKPGWPNPLGSICTEDQWNFPRANTCCWSISGPALDLYNSIIENIRNSIEDRGEDIFKDTIESAVPHSIACFMVGSRMEKARPYIVISCTSPVVCKRIRSVIEETVWWRELIELHTGFGGFVLKSGPLRRMAASGKAVSSPWVYTCRGSGPLSNLPVFFADELLDQEIVQTPAQAILGGIIYLDAVPFGLTVAHPFCTSFVSWSQDSPIMASTFQADAIFEMDDGGDDVSPASPAAFSNGMASQDMSPELEEKVNFVAPRIISGIPRLVGKLLFRSEGTPSDEADWALVMLNLDLDGRDRTKWTWSLNLGKCLRPEHNRVLISLVRRGRIVDGGKIIPGKQLIWLQGSDKYVSAIAVSLQARVIAGDCGTWILDQDKTWLGHLVAGIPGTNIAYLVSASRIVADIQKCTNISPSIVAPDGVLLLLDCRPPWGIATLSPAPEDDISINMLYLVSSHNRVGALRLLLDSGLHVNIPGTIQHMALQTASRSGHLEIVRLLIEHGVAVNSTEDGEGSALQAASAGGHAEVVELLLSQGADFNASGEFYAIHPLNSDNQTAKNKSISTLNDGRGGMLTKTHGTAIQVASENGHLEIVKLLLPSLQVMNDAGNIRFKSLFEASRNGHLQVVRVLTEEGVKAQTQEQKTRLDQALLDICRRGHRDIAKLLIETGANVDAKESGLTAIRLAASCGNRDVAQVLLDHGAGADIDDDSVRFLGLVMTGRAKKIREDRRLAEHAAKYPRPPRASVTILKRAVEMSEVEDLSVSSEVFVMEKVAGDDANIAREDDDFEILQTITRAGSSSNKQPSSDSDKGMD